MHNVVTPVTKLSITAYSGGFPEEYDKVIIARTAVGPIVICLVLPKSMYINDPAKLE